MKKRIAILGVTALAAVGVYSQSVGMFNTQVVWSPYVGADGFVISVGLASPSNPPPYFTNYVVSGAATSFVIAGGSPGTAYRSSIRAFANDGRMSVPTADVVWTNPPLLGPITGYRPAAIVYVP